MFLKLEINRLDFSPAKVPQLNFMRKRESRKFTHGRNGCHNLLKSFEFRTNKVLGVGDEVGSRQLARALLEVQSNGFVTLNTELDYKWKWREFHSLIYDFSFEHINHLSSPIIRRRISFETSHVVVHRCFVINFVSFTLFWFFLPKASLLQESGNWWTNPGMVWQCTQCIFQEAPFNLWNRRYVQVNKMCRSFLD